MNYKVVGFTLEYKRPEKRYFVELGLRSRVPIAKRAVNNPFVARQHRSSAIDFYRRRERCYGLRSIRVACTLDYSGPGSISFLRRRGCDAPLRVTLFHPNLIDTYFRGAGECARHKIAKKPLPGVIFKVRAPIVLQYARAGTAIKSTLIPENHSPSSSCDGDDEIVVEVNMNNIQGLEREVLRLSGLYTIREVSDTRPWIVSINNVVGVVTRKCNVFAQNIVFRPESPGSPKDSSLYCVVKSLVKKHFLQ